MTAPGSPRTPGSPDPGSSPGHAGPAGTPGRPPAAAGAAGSPDRTGGQQPPQRERHTGRAIGRSLALALLIFVTVILVLFVVFNTQTVDISLVFADVSAPLVVALLIAAALGGLLVWLAGLVLRARRRKS